MEWNPSFPAHNENIFNSFHLGEKVTQTYNIFTELKNKGHSYSIDKLLILINKPEQISMFHIISTMGNFN